MADKAFMGVLWVLNGNFLLVKCSLGWLTGSWPALGCTSGGWQQTAG